MWLIVIGFIFSSVIIVGRLIDFQVVQGPHWEAEGERIQLISVVDQPDRGIIYDANGAVLAGNSADYQIGASPSLIVEAEEMATALAPILQKPRYELLALLQSDNSYVLL